MVLEMVIVLKVMVMIAVMVIEVGVMTGTPRAWHCARFFISTYVFKFSKPLYEARNILTSVY